MSLKWRDVSNFLFHFSPSLLSDVNHCCVRWRWDLHPGKIEHLLDEDLNYFGVNSSARPILGWTCNNGENKMGKHIINIIFFFKHSIWLPTFAAVNVIAGIGLLSTPYTVKEAGWASLLVLVLFTSVFCYTAVLMKHCLESTKGILTFPDMGEAAFGKWGRIFITVSWYIFLLSWESIMKFLLCGIIFYIPVHFTFFGRQCS